MGVKQDGNTKHIRTEKYTARDDGQERNMVFAACWKPDQPDIHRKMVDGKGRRQRYLD